MNENRGETHENKKPTQKLSRFSKNAHGSYSFHSSDIGIY